MKFKEPDTYGEPIIMTAPGLIAKIYKPILTPEERERRMKEVRKAAAAVLRSAEEAKQRSQTAVE